MTLRLFHLLNGVSLVAVSTVTFALKIGDFSDVAFMKKESQMWRTVQTNKRGLVAQRAHFISETGVFGRPPW
jgi:hypothetical protein